MSPGQSDKKEELKKMRQQQSEIHDKSLLIIYTGNGKGKTSAALGTAMRMLLHGHRVAMLQFMKKEGEYQYAESKLAALMPSFELFTMGDGFTWDRNNPAQDRATAAKGWQKAVELMESGRYSLVVLDELIYVLHYGFLDEEMVLAWLAQKPAGLHVVLTGRHASPALVELADLVTEMTEIKHPYKTRGLLAQKGIDW